jgi:hypothetical protein
MSELQIAIDSQIQDLRVITIPSSQICDKPMNIRFFGYLIVTIVIVVNDVNINNYTQWQIIPHLHLKVIAMETGKMVQLFIVHTSRIVAATAKTNIVIVTEKLSLRGSH